MWVYLCIHAHTHRDTAHGVLGCEPRGQDEAPGEPEESRWLKSWHTCICIRVQSTHGCNMLGGGMCS